MTKITDNNPADLPSDDEEECIKTPGGNYKIKIDLDSDVLNNLVDVWARENLQDASLEQYTEVMEDTGDQRDALHGAVINEIIIDALTQQIARQQAEIDANAKDV